MSATRRAASETNILAMLDRQASAALPQRLLRAVQALPAMFWYGTAGVLVCGLVATLAWLARDGGASATVDSALAGSIAPARARVAEATGLRAADASASVTAYMPTPVPAPAPASAPDPAPGTGAKVVNLAPAAEAAPAQLAVSAVAHPLPAAAAAPSQREQLGRITPRDAQRLAAHAAMARSAPPHATAQGKPASTGTAPAALAHAGRTSAHGRRAAQPAKAPPAAVDTDVALISAIIQHAANRQEAEEAACADRACGPRMPARP